VIHEMRVTARVHAFGTDPMRMPVRLLAALAAGFGGGEVGSEVGLRSDRGGLTEPVR